MGALWLLAFALALPRPYGLWPSGLLAFGLLAFWPFGLLAVWPFGLLAFWPYGLLALRQPLSLLTSWLSLHYITLHYINL